MTTGALIFMLAAWSFVFGLTGWSYYRVLNTQAHFDPDGIGPDSPPVQGKFDESGEKLSR